jgi:alpha-galactosidase
LLNREIIAVQQDVLGRQGRRVLKTAGGLQLWRRELEGGAVAVAVHNELDEPTAAALPEGLFDLRLFGYSAADRVFVKELVAGEELGVFVASVEGLGPIPAHGSLMLLLRLAPVALKLV